MRFTIEAYGGPCDDMAYAGRADEPMGEFWIGGGGAARRCKRMASAAHVYGKPIVGAEAFTAGDQERWLRAPGVDQGAGRPGVLRGRSTGSSSTATRCSRGSTPARDDDGALGPALRAHADVVGAVAGRGTSTWRAASSCCGRARSWPISVSAAGGVAAGVQGHKRNGYDYDDVPAELLIEKASVENGRCRPAATGTTYRVLVLPETTRMTPALLKKVRELAEAGAPIVGPVRPTKAPGLADYPELRRGGRAARPGAVGVGRKSGLEQVGGGDARPGAGGEGFRRRLPGSAGSIAARAGRRSTLWPATVPGRERRCARSACLGSGRRSGVRRRAGSSLWPSMSRRAE